MLGPELQDGCQIPNLKTKGKASLTLALTWASAFIWHLPACAKPRLLKPCAAGRRFGEGRDFEP
jgi:hypothetical protein